jgi:hypothetical protein
MLIRCRTGDGTGTPSHLDVAISVAAWALHANGCQRERSNVGRFVSSCSLGFATSASRLAPNGAGDCMTRSRGPSLPMSQSGDHKSPLRVFFRDIRNA